MEKCASIDTAVTFNYEVAGVDKTCLLKKGVVIRIYGINQYGVAARAKTPDGCQDGIIYDTGFYSILPDCSTCPC